MKNKILIPLVLLMAIFFSCEVEEGCDDCNLNPKVKVSFEALASRKLVDSLFTVVKDEIASRVELLELGEMTPEEIAVVEQELIVFRNDSTRLNEDFSLFRSGSAKMDFVSANGGKSMDFFQDTVIRNFAVPVDMQTDTSTFYFEYHGFSDTLQIYYDRNIVQTLDGVRMRVQQIGVNEEISTFDSIRVQCNKRECSNDQTTIHIYF